MAGGVRSRRLSGHKKQSLDAIRNDINVTPLVDIVLVLLIIFMVTSQLMVRGKNVPTLPKTKFHNRKEKDRQQPVIAVDKEGDLWFDRDKLGQINDGTLDVLAKRVKNAWTTAKNQEGVGKVYVKAAGELEYRQIYPLLTYLRTSDLDIGSIDLGTEEFKGKE